MKKQSAFSIVLAICICSIIFNIVQYSKSTIHSNELSFNSTKFRNGFSDIIKSFDLYNGGTLSEEEAVRNSAVSVASIRSLQPFTSYRNNQKLNEMLLCLEQFFVFQQIEIIKGSSKDITNYLLRISKNFNDANLVIEFNEYLKHKLNT